MQRPDTELNISGRLIGENHPTYFIADIAANHDGDLERAKDLIYQAAEAGADAAKFQHFQAKTIVSDHGFKSLGGQQSHQAKWKKSVFEVYQDASVPLLWTQTLKETCDAAGITFFTSPYDKALVDHIDPYVPAFKIGSGDITWLDIITHIAAKQKPYIIASGASSMDEVDRAVQAALAVNTRLALLQCNTNYTASLENFKYIQLNVLKCYRIMYPEMVLGLSDHTLGHTTVLGAVALGARIIEKHFTDDTKREGPDHGFSMDPQAWRAMVDATRELENALGNGIKRVEENEKQTAILQRRAVRVTRDLAAGSVLTADDVTVLRPCPTGAISAADEQAVPGRTLRREVKGGEHLSWGDLA
ncbi:N-acetylneuraminate synthase family protein [Massilia sp. W12]|uniref:N-acetylneuraminate synthase family protein n=1 Tax=Massilia sp. W12 TaxID=3126507 RepID=UPI0030D1CC10